MAVIPSLPPPSPPPPSPPSAPLAPAVAVAPVASAGWFADPWRIAPYRWWDGHRWTPYLGGPTQVAAPVALPLQTLPLRAAWVVLGALFLSIGSDRLYVDRVSSSDWPVWTLILGSVVLGYGPALAAGIFALRRWGTGRWRDSIGLWFKPVDFAWGPLAWVSIYVGNIVLAVIITVTHLPISSNVRGVGTSRLGRSVLLPLALVAVVAAPIIEELLFRGIILRAFRSRMAFLPSVVLQGIFFGLCHMSVAYGAGNLGLVIVLSWVGTAFGCVALWLRRIGPTMLAHGMFNGVVFLILWLAPHALAR